MSEPYQYITNHEQVIRAFGYWPSFHDSEVRSLTLDRNSVLFGQIADARLDVILHAFEWTRETKPAFNHHLVNFRFYGIQEIVLDSFNHQNALLEFKVEEWRRGPDAPIGLRLTFVPAFGLAGFLRASSGEVLSVVACDERGKLMERARLGTAPKGGPTTPVGSSDTAEGPSSVR